MPQWNRNKLATISLPTLCTRCILLFMWLLEFFSIVYEKNITLFIQLSETVVGAQSFKEESRWASNSLFSTSNTNYEHLFTLLLPFNWPATPSTCRLNVLPSPQQLKSVSRGYILVVWVLWQTVVYSCTFIFYFLSHRTRRLHKLTVRRSNRKITVAKITSRYVAQAAAGGRKKCTNNELCAKRSCREIQVEFIPKQMHRGPLSSLVTFVLALISLSFSLVWNTQKLQPCVI